MAQTSNAPASNRERTLQLGAVEIREGLKTLDGNDFTHIPRRDGGIHLANEVEEVATWIKGTPVKFAAALGDKEPTHTVSFGQGEFGGERYTIQGEVAKELVTAAAKLIETTGKKNQAQIDNIGTGLEERLKRATIRMSHFGDDANVESERKVTLIGSAVHVVEGDISWTIESKSGGKFEFTAKAGRDAAQAYTTEPPAGFDLAGAYELAKSEFVQSATKSFHALRDELAKTPADNIEVTEKDRMHGDDPVAVYSVDLKSIRKTLVIECYSSENRLSGPVTAALDNTDDSSPKAAQFNRECAGFLAKKLEERLKSIDSSVRGAASDFASELARRAQTGGDIDGLVPKDRSFFVSEIGLPSNTPGVREFVSTGKTDAGMNLRVSAVESREDLFGKPRGDYAVTVTVSSGPVLHAKDFEGEAAARVLTEIFRNEPDTKRMQFTRHGNAPLVGEWRGGRIGSDQD